MERFFEALGRVVVRLKYPVEILMTRIREEAHKMPLRQAVSHAVGISGSAITRARVILAGTFAVLAIAAGNSSSADQIRQIGDGIAAGVLMPTFLIRTILVPSIVVLLSRWNWWPSALFRHSEARESAYAGDGEAIARIVS